MKRIQILFYSLAMLFGFSCSQEEPSPPLPVNDETPSIQKIGISPDVKNLQTTDAEIVASIFINNGRTSRAENKSIKNVVSIPNDAGLPSLYAVNFNDGYVIVPVSKNLAPILAVVDHGNFSLDDKPSGRDIIISQLIAESDYWQIKGGNDNVKDEWRKYTLFPSETPTEISRANELDDPWNVMYNQLYEFQDMGYECYRITKFEDDQDILPDDILQRFKRTARFEDNIWEDEYGEEFMYETALVVIKDQSMSSTRTKCLTTTWSQNYPYNYGIGGINPLGCVTIATAQIMKYHNYPTSYDWAAMPNIQYTAGSNTLTNFLTELHNKLGVTDSGASSINDAERVFKSYGYKVTKSNHKNGNYRYPTYCRGESIDGSKTDGHAWVCDGELSSSYATFYELYLFDNAYYPKFVYRVMDTESSYHYSPTLYHMNWGWGGLSDGYFSDSNMAAYNGEKTYYFNNNRKDLFISKP